MGNSVVFNLITGQKFQLTVCVDSLLEYIFSSSISQHDNQRNQSISETTPTIGNSQPLFQNKLAQLNCYVELSRSE